MRLFNELGRALLVAAALVIRFVRSGGAPMLKTMGCPAQHEQMRGDAEPQPHQISTLEARQ